ncbi:MAG: alkaline phosphatase D family protein [Myxococcota bacterium]|nr:alkaline phosphatase D family protein [Myxococcota bacterium]
MARRRPPIPPPIRSHGTSRRTLLGGLTALAACGGRGDSGGSDDTAVQEDDSGIADDSGTIDDTADTGEPVDPGPPEVVFDAAGISEDPGLFPTAIQAGAMRQTSVLLAAYVDDGQPVVIRVWQPVKDDVVRLLHDAVYTPKEGYLKVTVEGLSPGEWYTWCVLRADGEDYTSRSLIAQFRTAIPEGSREPLTVAISACNGPFNDPWPALERTAEYDYDLFIHLGDMSYNDSCTTLAEFRERWQWYLSGDGFRAAYARAGLLATWDDHEITNDWSGTDVDSEALANGMQAFFETLAVEQGKDGQLWGSFRWGDTAEFFVLDCRSERDEDAGTYLSYAQMQWLKQGISESPCHFKVIVNSVPITNMPSVWDLAASDRWEGYPSHRNELLDHIGDNTIENVWFLSGDFHVCFTAKVQPDASGVAGKTWEIAVTGGNSNPLGESLNWFYADQFPYSASSARTVLLTFDPDADTVEVKFIDPDDGSLDYGETLSQ